MSQTPLVTWPALVVCSAALSAGLIFDRTHEDFLAAYDGLFFGHYFVLHFFGHHVAHRSQVDDTVSQSRPVCFSFPGSFFDLVDGINVEWSPVPDRCGQMGLRGELTHVGIIAD